MIKRELNLLFLTFQYYSRIPTPRTEYSEEALSRAFRYFPLVGTVVGCLGALTFIGAGYILPKEVCVILAMIVMTFATGAIHEDGFSDTFDGFGGGYDRERILAIMRDSTSGVYGVTALILLFGLEFVLLKYLPSDLIPISLIAVHTSSRMMPLFMIHEAEYARRDTSKGMHTRRKLSQTTLVIALILSALSLLLLPLKVAVWIPLVYFFVYVIFKRIALRKIGGYTGDVLGALIVLCQMSAFLTILITHSIEWL